MKIKFLTTPRTPIDGEWRRDGEVAEVLKCSACCLICKGEARRYRWCDMILDAIGLAAGM